MASILADIVLNAVIEWLSPQEYDGRAFMTLSESDPRLRIGALLLWEARNCLQALQWVGEGLLTPLCQFFATASARDKAARLAQYMIKLIVGVISTLSPDEGRTQLHRLLSKVVLTFSNARRTTRLLEVGPFRTALMAHANFPVGSPKQAMQWGLVLAARWAAAGFHSLDRVRWFQQHDLIHGNASKTGRFSFRCLMMAHACKALHEIIRAAATEEATRLLRLLRQSFVTSDTQQLEQPRDSSTRSRDELFGGLCGLQCPDRRIMLEAMREILKQFMCLLQTAHLGKISALQTGDLTVGLLGILTTCDDLRILWNKQG